MIEIVDLALTAAIGSFEIYTINSSVKKKIETNFIMSKAIFGAGMRDCRGVGESRIYSKRAKKSPSAGFVNKSGITDLG